MAEDKNSPLADIGKMGLPIGIVATLVWLVASFVYGAGSKVAASDRDLGFLTSRVDQLEKQLKESDEELRKQHDSEMDMQTRLTSLREYIDSVEASKNITVSMDPPAKRR